MSLIEDDRLCDTEGENPPYEKMNSFENEYEEDGESNKESKEKILESIKLKDTEIDITPIKKKRKSKIDGQDIQDMSDKEIISYSSDEIQQLYGEFSSFIETKTDLKEDNLVKGVIPSNLKLLNAILGGGFTIGGLNTIVGNTGCGKTMLVIQTIGNAQKYYNKRILASYIDTEYSTTTIRLANLGVRYPRIKPFSEDVTVEKVFQFIEGTCLYKEQKGITDIPSVIGWDSIANTLTQKEKECEDPKEVVGYRARVYSLLIPRYIAKCSKYNISILSINQLRDSVDMGKFPKPKDLKFMNKNYDVPGGKALKYNAFQFLEMRQTSMTKKEIEKYDFEGLMAEIMCVKNKLFRPKLPIRIIGDFTTGFSDFWTNFVFLVDNKWIKPSGWNTLVNYPSKKFRTKEAEGLYTTDEDFRKAYDEAVTNCINEQIIKPNTVILED